jgi:hypothetical protein
MFAQQELFANDKKGPPTYFIPGSFLIKLRDVPGLAPDTFFASHHIESKHAKKTPRVYSASIPTDITGQNDIEKLFKTIVRFNGTDPTDQNITFVSPDQSTEFAEPRQCSFHDELSLPDPQDYGYASYQWALKNTAGGSLGCNVKGAWGRDFAKPAPLAGKIRLGRPEVVLAVIDTGCDLNHQDFSDSIYLADNTANTTWNPFTTSFHPSSTGADDYDGASHGTNVCAAIVAHTSYSPNSTSPDPKLGIAGIAPSCRLMPIKVDLWAGTADDRADAIDFVKKRAIDVDGRPERIIMNCSWKFDGSSPNLIMDAITQAAANNVLVVCACWDAASGVDVLTWGQAGAYCPASHPNVIPVVAMLKAGGKRTDSNFKAAVAVYGPGENIRTYNNNSNIHYYKHKTSMAAAFVSGIAALAWSYNFERSIETGGLPGSFGLRANTGSTPTLKGILTTVNGGGASGGLRTDGTSSSHGKGRIDALMALNAVPNAAP